MVNDLLATRADRVDEHASIMNEFMFIKRSMETFYSRIIRLCRRKGKGAAAQLLVTGHWRRQISTDAFNDALHEIAVGSGEPVRGESLATIESCIESAYSLWDELAGAQEAIRAIDVLLCERSGGDM